MIDYLSSSVTPTILVLSSQIILFIASVMIKYLHYFYLNFMVHSRKMLVLMFSPSFNIPFHRICWLSYIDFIELIILVTTVVKFALFSDQGVISPSHISI